MNLVIIITQDHNKADAKTIYTPILISINPGRKIINVPMKPNINEKVRIK